MPRLKKPDNGAQGLMQAAKRSLMASSRVSDGLLKLMELQSELETERHALREAFLQAACAEDSSDHDIATVMLLSGIFPEGEIVGSLLRKKRNLPNSATPPDIRPAATA